MMIEVTADGTNEARGCTGRDDTNDQQALEDRIL